MLEKKFARALNEIENIAPSGEDRVGAIAFSNNLDEGIGIYQPDDLFYRVKN